MAFAHSKNDDGKLHDLIEHLERVYKQRPRFSALAVAMNGGGRHG